MAKAKVAPHVSRASRAVSRIKDFLERYNGQRLSIRGEDLKAMGLEPGPGFRNILKKVLYEKIDGNLKTKADERRFAVNMVSALGMRKKS